MTTKKIMQYIEKQTKEILNINYEPIFGDYIVYQGLKRIGYLADNKLYLIATPTLKKLLPDVNEEKTFSRESVLLIADTENMQLLADAISAVYNDKYFLDDAAFDLSEIMKSYTRYPDWMHDIYTHTATFLKFCTKKKLIAQKNILDENGKILYMSLKYRDLTKMGIDVFSELYTKWIRYNDKKDHLTEKRAQNEKMLEKYYKEIIASLEDKKQ